MKLFRFSNRQALQRTLSKSLEILKQYWGFDSFRKQQDRIIESVLQGKDTLALLPTGGGKSICYQVPGLMKEGLCLVISPLIALMEDQVQGLRKKGIKAVAINSSLSKRQIDILLDNAIYGGTKFLFVSPERLKSRLFLARLEKMNINLIAVDEAHCISEWGYDFRPAYLEIATIREKLPSAPIIALTATATPKVCLDIQEKLNFKDSEVFLESFERANLSYNTNQSNNKLNRLQEFLKNHTDSGIVYASTRKAVKNLTQTLTNLGFSCTFYHGGLDHETRTERQNKWLKEEVQIMVATNAFGMGIDKPAVGFVVHMDIPETLEAYFQEAGRAGRNGDKATTDLFYEPADIATLTAKIEAKFPPPDQIRTVYKCLGNYFQLATGSGRDEAFPFDLLDFCDRYDFDLIETYSALKIMDIDGFIKLSENFNHPAKIKILVDNKALYQFQVRDSKADRLLQFLLRTHIGIFDDFVNFNLGKTVKHTGLNYKELNQILSYLEQQEAIFYSPDHSGSSITYLTERLQESQMHLSAGAYINRKKTAEEKLEAMIGFLSSNQCNSEYLLNYFGEKNTTPCGICSNCKKQETLKTPKDLPEQLLAYMLQSKSELQTSNLIAAFDQYSKDEVVQGLRWLIDHKKVEADAYGETFKVL